MKKQILVFTFMVLSYMSISQTMDIYHDAIFMHIKYKKVKRDTLNFVYHEYYIDSTRHTTPDGIYLNFVSEDDFPKYCDEKTKLLVYRVFPITFRDGEMRIRIVEYGIISKKEQMPNNSIRNDLVITSGSYVEYKVLFNNRRKKNFKFKVISEH